MSSTSPPEENHNSWDAIIHPPKLAGAMETASSVAVVVKGFQDFDNGMIGILNVKLNRTDIPSTHRQINVDDEINVLSFAVKKKPLSYDAMYKATPNKEVVGQMQSNHPLKPRHFVTLKATAGEKGSEAEASIMEQLHLDATGSPLVMVSEGYLSLIHVAIINALATDNGDWNSPTARAFPAVTMHAVLKDPTTHFPVLMAKRLREEPEKCRHVRSLLPVETPNGGGSGNGIASTNDNITSDSTIVTPAATASTTRKRTNKAIWSPSVSESQPQWDHQKAPQRLKFNSSSSDSPAESQPPAKNHTTEQSAPDTHLHAPTVLEVGNAVYMHRDSPGGPKWHKATITGTSNGTYSLTMDVTDVKLDGIAPSSLAPATINKSATGPALNMHQHRYVANMIAAGVKAATSKAKSEIKQVKEQATQSIQECKELVMKQAEAVSKDDMCTNLTEALETAEGEKSLRIATALIKCLDEHTGLNLIHGTPSPISRRSEQAGDEDGENSDNESVHTVEQSKLSFADFSTTSAYKAAVGYNMSAHQNLTIVIEGLDIEALGSHPEMLATAHELFGWQGLPITSCDLENQMVQLTDTTKIQGRQQLKYYFPISPQTRMFRSKVSLATAIYIGAFKAPTDIFEDGTHASGPKRNMHDPRAPRALKCPKAALDCFMRLFDASADGNKWFLEIGCRDTFGSEYHLPVSEALKEQLLCNELAAALQYTAETMGGLGLQQGKQIAVYQCNDLHADEFEQAGIAGFSRPYRHQVQTAVPILKRTAPYHPVNNATELLGAGCFDGELWRSMWPEPKGSSSAGTSAHTNTNTTTNLSMVQNQQMSSYSSSLLPLGNQQSSGLLQSKDPHNTPCVSFHDTGNCKFGDRCYRSHVSPPNDAWLDSERARLLKGKTQRQQREQRERHQRDHRDQRDHHQNYHQHPASMPPPPRGYTQPGLHGPGAGAYGGRHGNTNNTNQVNKNAATHQLSIKKCFDAA